MKNTSHNNHLNGTGPIIRKNTVQVMVGNVPVGGDAPIVVQSMTNTDTADVDATVRQITELYDAGSELVRVTVNNKDAARAVPFIVDLLDRKNVDVPVIGDFHYNGHMLLTQFPDCAKTLAKYRINPGNTGTRTRDVNFCTIVEQAVKWDKPVRIGVNWGSLDQQLLAEKMDANNRLPAPKSSKEVMIDTMLESAMRSARMAEETGLAHNKIIVSCKISGVQDLITVYRRLSEMCDYPLHLGLTEAGMGMKGIAATTSALSVLLQEGIGDTIRASLTPAPGGDRADEVRLCQQILQSLGIRSFIPQVTACPGCGRTKSTYFQELADEIQRYIAEMIPVWRQIYPGVEEMHIAVMGCVVNGPGESKNANIGISLPGTFEEPKAPVYVDGKHYTTLTGDHIGAEFQKILEDYIIRNYSKVESI